MLKLKPYFRLMGHMPDGSLVSASTLADACEVSITTIWRWSKSGRLPPAIKVGPNSTRWHLGQVRASLGSKTDGQEAA